MTERVIAVSEPFRLDLTVAVLRRFSTNVVDVVSSDGVYRRALAGNAAPAIVTIAQRSSSEIAVRVNAAQGDEERIFALVPRMLGTERDLERFDRGAAAVPWLRALALRMRGVKPPRYATLWEACVNAVVFQHVSLHAASAILRRTILAIGEPLDAAGAVLYAFPTIDALLAASDDTLRGTGLSTAKIATLRRAGETLRSGAIDEPMLEERDSADASALLCTVKGIGPWTAAVILLRGLGRLDVFPEKDSGVARGLASLAGDELDMPGTLEALGPQRGMLYYHLLLARLEARGEIEPSAAGFP